MLRSPFHLRPPQHHEQPLQVTFSVPWIKKEHLVGPLDLLFFLVENH